MKVPRIFHVCMYVCIGLVLAGAVSCLNGYNPKNPTSAVVDDGISIFNGDPSVTGVKSYQTLVKQYYSHDRTGVEMESRTEYRLSLKVIDGELYTRIDLAPDEFADSRSRTLISNSNETVMFFSDTMEIIHRFPLSDFEKRMQLISTDMSVVGRVNLSGIRAAAERLSFDVSEDTSGMIELNVPGDFYPVSGNGTGYSSRVRTSRLLFDGAQEILSSSEMVIEENNGTIITIENTPIYKEFNDELIKVGEITSLQYEFPYTLDVSDSVVQSYQSVEDIPVISQDELERLQKAGLASLQNTQIWLGDQSDPSYTETITTVYTDIHLNTLADTFFRSIF